MTTCPFVESTTAMISFSQTVKRRWCLRSMASPLGDSHGASFQRAATVFFFASIVAISLVSSTLTKTVP